MITVIEVDHSFAICFPHQILQDVHDIIAAQFRYVNPDSKQFSLIENSERPSEEALDDKLRKDWFDFFIAKAKDIATNPNYCRQLLTAIIYEKFNLTEEIVSDLIIYFDLPFTIK